VKEIESKRAVLMWHAAPGCLRWNCAIFNFACSCVPLVITLIIALPLYQVLQAVVVHPVSSMASTLYLSSLSTRVVGGGGVGRRPGMGSGCTIDNLTMGNTGWRWQKWGGRARQYAPRPTHASTTNGPKRWWDNLDDGLLVVISLPSNQTLSPGLKTGAGSRQRL
jgi:hypothetical protein